MNNTTIAHIGGELIVIGGLAFYLNRKIGTLQGTITKMNKEQNELIEHIDQLEEQVQHLIATIQMMQGRAPPAQAPRPPVAQRPRRQPPTSATGGSSSSRPKAQRPAAKPRRRRNLTSEDSGDDTLDDRDLDTMLKDEISQLDTERVKECDGEVCELVE